MGSGTMIESTVSLLLLVTGLVATGTASGFLAGLLGVGGGIVMVPALFHLLDSPGIDDGTRMHMAVGTSLAIIIPTALSSSLAHYRRNSVDIDVLKTWAPGILAGSILAGFIAASIRGHVLTGIFAATALLVAVHMAFSTGIRTFQNNMPGLPGRFGLGTIIGTLATLMGIGGATLSVPVMTAFSVPVHRAVGTASALGLMTGIPGAIGFALGGLDIPGRPPWSLGYISLPGAIIIAPLSVLLAPMGARTAHRTNARRLRQIFALFLFLTGLQMLWSTQG